jgi:hypothetical protein
LDIQALTRVHAIGQVPTVPEHVGKSRTPRFSPTRSEASQSPLAMRGNLLEPVARVHPGREPNLSGARAFRLSRSTAPQVGIPYRARRVPKAVPLPASGNAWGVPPPDVTTTAVDEGYYGERPGRSGLLTSIKPGCSRSGGIPHAMRAARPGGSLTRRKCRAGSTTRIDPAASRGTLLVPGPVVARIA